MHGDAGNSAGSGQGPQEEGDQDDDDIPLKDKVSFEAQLTRSYL